MQYTPLAPFSTLTLPQGIQTQLTPETVLAQKWPSVCRLTDGVAGIWSKGRQWAASILHPDREPGSQQACGGRGQDGCR